MDEVKLTPTTVIESRYMGDFWNFVAERQAIYWLRKEGKPRPWTEDPILDTYFFTNVYRELDAGTRYYVEHVLNPTKHSHRLLLFNTLAYRYFNNEPTWEFLTQAVFQQPYIPLGEWDNKQVAKQLTWWEDQGNKVFTGAFTVTGNPFGGFPDKIGNVCWLVKHFDVESGRLVRQILKAHNLEDVFNSILGLLGMGPFLAYEVTIDLNYAQTFVHYSEDDFVNPGPGCKRGLDYIFLSHKDDSYRSLIYYLRYTQDKWFDAIGKKFQRLDGKELSLRNIEHSLCEYQKYARTKYGISPSGKPNPVKTRRFQPTSTI